MNRWTTGQVAKQRAISVRTLRYYDQIDLLCPGYRDEHGKRYYSEDDLFRLEKILLLKELGLPLDEIAQVLESASYRDILIMHHNHLQDQLTTVRQQIAHTISLLHMLDMEQTLSWERVSELVRQSKTAAPKWKDYFRKEEQIFLQNTLPRLEQNDQATQQYASLLRRIEWCVSHGIPPQSEMGKALGEELLTLSDETFGGDQVLANKFWEIRKRPAQETGLFPLSEEVLLFVEQSLAFAENLQKTEEKDENI